MTLLKEIWWPWSYAWKMNISLMQNILAVLAKKEQKVFIWLSPCLPRVSPMNKNCWMGCFKDLISLSRRESPPLCQCFRFILLPSEAEGFEIFRETAFEIIRERDIGVVIGTHQLHSSVILRTTVRRDLSKSSAAPLMPCSCSVHVCWQPWYFSEGVSPEF